MRCGLVLALLAACLPGLVAAQDRVVRESGSPLVGVVKSEDYREVKIDVRRGGEVIVAADQVKDVIRGDAPDAYTEGRQALKDADLVNADSLLQAAAVESKTTWVKEYATFYRAVALRAKNRLDDAVASYKKVLEVNPQSRFMPEVNLGIARCYAQAGKRDEAIKVLDDFVKEVNQKTLPEVYSLKARTLQGSLFTQADRHEEAAAAFEGVVRAAESLLSKASDEAEKGSYRQILLRARRDLGTAYVKAKKFTQAETTFRALAAQNPDSRAAQAMAAIGLAEVELGKGNADLARVQLTDVLAVHFAADEEMPAALWLLGRAYDALEEKGEKGARERGRRYLRDLVKHYPGSDQAAEARKLLK